jgi:hypothetical protein
MSDISSDNNIEECEFCDLLYSQCLCDFCEMCGTMEQIGCNCSYNVCSSCRSKECTCKCKNCGCLERKCVCRFLPSQQSMKK